MKNNFLLVTTCAVIALGAFDVNAQTINYGAMEELFGEPVTTSATGKPQRLSEVPMTMEILTQEDIRRSGAENLAEVLRQVNGVNVVQKTASQYDVSIRGYNHHNSQQLLVLINGRQIYLDHYGYTPWEAVPVRMEEIRQIEVIKGPNMALFGFNAASGVVNIVTDDPMYSDTSSAGVTLGTNDYREAHYVQSMKLSDKIATRISAGIKNSNDFNNKLNLASSISGSADNAGFVDPQSETLNIDTVFKLSDKSQLRLEIAGANTKEATHATTNTMYNFEHETRSVKATYGLDSEYGLIKANIYKNILDWDAVSSISAVKARNEVLVAQVEDTIELNPNHTVRAQVEYRDNKLTGSLMTDDAEVGYDVYAGGGMWNWKISDQLSWTNAARIDYMELYHKGSFLPGSLYTNEDYNAVDHTEFSYNSGLLWTPTYKDVVRLSTARGLVMPSLLELGTDYLLHGVITYAGSPILDPSVVTNYELAWDRKIDQIDGMFRSAVFYNETKDIKTLAITPDGMPLNRIGDNIGDSKSHGIEFELKGELNENVDWGVGYIYQRIKDDLNNGKLGHTLVVGKEYEDSNPEHHLNFKLGYKKGPWEADGLVYYVSDSIQLATVGSGVKSEKIDSYVGVNARVGYTFDDDLTLSVHGQQLQTSQVQTGSAPDVDRRVYLSLTKKF